MNWVISMSKLHIGTWGKSLVESLLKQGISPIKIVGNTGINLRKLDGDNPRIAFDQLAELFERAAEITDNYLFCFQHGQNREVQRSGLISFVSSSSPSVRTLLITLARYQRITGDAIEITTDQLDSDGIIEWYFAVPSGVKRRQYFEFSGTGIIDDLRRLTDRRLTPEKIEFKHHRDSNNKPLEAFFGCRVEYGSDQNRIIFRQSDLDLPLRSADNHLHKMLKKYSEEAVSETTKNKMSMTQEVEQKISLQPGKTQEKVAKELGVSTRTLARRLKAEKTTYFKVVEAYREAMAKSMLSDTETQITEIAFVLGYADTSTFSSAFKRWSGKSPSEYRT